jgi:hypothetical protein
MATFIKRVIGKDGTYKDVFVMCPKCIQEHLKINADDIIKDRVDVLEIGNFKGLYHNCFIVVGSDVECREGYEFQKVLKIKYNALFNYESERLQEHSEGY